MGSWVFDNYATNQGSGDWSLPSPEERSSTGYGGESTLNAPSGSFDAGDAGAAGAAGGVLRNGEKRKDRIQGIRPLCASGDTYAVLQLVSDGGGGGGSGFDSFLLTGVSRGSEERYQIFETWRDPLLYLMDKAPEVYSFTGHIPTGVDSSGRIWSDDFANFYENELRGTKCVENGVRAAISYNSLIASGYVLNFKINENAEQPTHGTFNFDLYVTAVKYLGA